MRKEGHNQFGRRLAVAIATTGLVAQCSNCHHIMKLRPNGKPPKRCSNRKNCGKMFRDVTSDVGADSQENPRS